MFVVPASKASTGEDQFEFEIDGQKFRVKKSNCMTLDEQIKQGKIEDTDALVDFVWGKRGTKLGDAVRKLEDWQFDQLRDARDADSEVTPGESKDS